MNKYMDRVEMLPFSGCWIWMGKLSEKGYGIISTKGVDKRAHRVFWEIENGPIPVGKYACHHCDTPACVRPDHIFIGSQKENLADCRRKGRNKKMENGDQKGAANRNAKLTLENVLDIRTKRLSKAEFARLYGVSFKAVKNVWDGKSWQELRSDGV